MGNNLQCRDLALNESIKNVGVNSRKEFIYTSIYNMDLRESKKTTQRHMFLRENPIWEKPQRGEREFTIYKEL